jgi:hypothetical protein
MIVKKAVQAERAVFTAMRSVTPGAAENPRITTDLRYKITSVETFVLKKILKNYDFAYGIYLTINSALNIVI